MKKLEQDVLDAAVKIYGNDKPWDTIEQATAESDQLRDATKVYLAAKALRITLVPETSSGLLDELGLEVSRAQMLHPGFPTHHHAYAVLKEELEEYWEEVKSWPKRHDPENMRKELIHVAAMALRTILEVPEDQWQVKPSSVIEFIEAQDVSKA